MNKFKCLRCNQYQYSASDVPTACIRCGSPTVLVAEDVKLAEETEKMRSHFGIEGAKRPLTRNQWFKLVQGSYVPVMKEAMEAREEDNVCNVFPHSIGVTYICREGKSAQEEFNQILNAKALVEEAKMKFNFNDYKGKYVMHCKTKEDAKEFCILMHEDGRKWFSGDSYLEIINWDDYSEPTVFYFNEGTFDDTDYAKKGGYTILEWADFKKEPVKEWVTALKYEFATNLPTFTEDVLRGYKSIYIDGVTIAIPMETIVGIAYKNPDDEHDPEFGKALAYFRMEGEE